MSTILTRSLTVRGFIQTEFRKTHYAAFQEDMAQWIRDGRILHREDVVEGLENAPEAFAGLLKGKSFGKLLVQVGEDPTREDQPRG